MKWIVLAINILLVGCAPQVVERVIEVPITVEVQVTAAPQIYPTPTTAGCPDGCIYPSDECIIKGNISVGTGEKIYHYPGDKYYEETFINPVYGERWFCTIDEAEANGWRRAESGTYIDDESYYDPDLWEKEQDMNKGFGDLSGMDTQN